MAKYLKITISDNDFTNSGYEVGHLIQGFCRYKCDIIEENDFPKIKKYIAYLWWSVDNLDEYLKWKDTEIDFHETRLQYFEECLQLSIVDSSDIPNWGDNDCIYVALNPRVIIK